MYQMVLIILVIYLLVHQLVKLDLIVVKILKDMFFSVHKH